jgi:hypothetical protein
MDIQTLEFPASSVEDGQIAAGQGQRLEIVNNFGVAEVLLGDNLVKMVTAVSVLLERISARDGEALARGQSSQVLLRHDVCQYS